MTIEDLIKTGSTRQFQFYPLLTHYVINGLYHLTKISPIILSQYFNPFIGALTVLPVYLLMRRFFRIKESLIISTLWTFSEAAAYRAATFGTTETLAMFLVVSSLYFYERKKYAISGVTLALSFASHLLPGVFAILTIFIHQLFFGPKRNKLAVCTLVLVSVIFLYSPLNPSQRIVGLINPLSILSHLKLSNISLYSLSDLYLGCKVYLGTVILLSFTFLSLFQVAIKSKLMWSMLLASFGLFLWGYIDYNAELFSPVRLVVYFVIPLSYFSVYTINWLTWSARVDTHPYKKLREILPIFLILIIMIGAFLNGLKPLLWVNDSLTANENRALDEIQQLQLIKIPLDDLGWSAYFWSDYPARISIVSRFIEGRPIIISLNRTRDLRFEKDLLNPYSTLLNGTYFKYVFFSERIERSGLFLLRTESRTLEVRKPVIDIWRNSSMWQLSYDDFGVKFYERIE